MSFIQIRKYIKNVEQKEKEIY